MTHRRRKPAARRRGAENRQFSLFSNILLLKVHDRLPTVQPLTPASALRAVPDLFISYPAYCDTMHIIAAAGPYEIGWVGTVRELGGEQYLIERVFLLPQKVSVADCDLDEEALGNLQYRLVTRAKSGKRLAASLRFWGHLHPLDPAPSLKDERTMQALATGEWPWFIRGIFTRVGDASCTFFDFVREVQVTDLPLGIAVADGGRRRKIQDQVRRLVRRVTVAPPEERRGTPHADETKHRSGARSAGEADAPPSPSS